MTSAGNATLLLKKILNPDLKIKFTRLAGIIGESPSAIVAYSGGVDSVFLAYVCRQILGRQKCLAYISISASLAQSEHKAALELAGELDLNIEVFESGEFTNPLYLQNDKDRCFYCKSSLFENLVKFARDKGIERVYYGGNKDDLSDYRPGHKAADKYKTMAPLALSGLSKADIRELSKYMGLPTHDKPAMPCLSSRLPYGNPITPDKLAMVEQGENFLRGLGYTICRVRHEGDACRLEVPVSQMAFLTDPEEISRLVKGMKNAGFKRVVLDLEGFRSGNLNMDIPDSGKTH